MHDCNRLGNLTLGITAAGVFVALLIVGYGVVLEHWSKKNEVYARHQESAQRQREDTAKDIEGACGGRSGDDLRSCVSEQIEAHDREQTTSQDLQAQQEMALWGLWVFIAAAFSSGMTTVGVYLIWQTLIYTRDAVGEARKTTVAAIKGADAAERSVDEARKATKFASTTAEVSREALLATDRAWIKIEIELTTPLVFDKEKIYTKARFSFENIGNSPATHVSVSRAEMIADISVASEKIRNDTEDSISRLFMSGMSFGSALFPGDKFSHEWELKLPTADFLSRIEERAETGSEHEEPYEVTTAHPAILAGVRYLLPGDKRYRFTYLPFEIQSTDAEHLGWDGAECRIEKDELTLRQYIISGHVS